MVKGCFRLQWYYLFEICFMHAIIRIINCIVLCNTLQYYAADPVTTEKDCRNKYRTIPRLDWLATKVLGENGLSIQPNTPAYGVYASIRAPQLLRDVATKLPSITAGIVDTRLSSTDKRLVFSLFFEGTSSKIMDQFQKLPDCIAELILQKVAQNDAEAFAQSIVPNMLSGPLLIYNYNYKFLNEGKQRYWHWRINTSNVSECKSLSLIPIYEDNTGHDMVPPRVYMLMYTVRIDHDTTLNVPDNMLIVGTITPLRSMTEYPTDSMIKSLGSEALCDQEITLELQKEGQGLVKTIYIVKAPKPRFGLSIQRMLYLLNTKIKEACSEKCSESNALCNSIGLFEDILLDSLVIHSPRAMCAYITYLMQKYCGKLQ
jgi:hypothetical protein